MTKHHIIISGTGRAGTTFLMQLFTLLGLDTGYNSHTMRINATARAGLEKAIGPNAPYILKRPSFCDELDGLVRSGDFIVDHAIVPVRDLYQAAESRRAVLREASKIHGKSWRGAGGLYGTEDPNKQEEVLSRKFYELMLTLARHDIPLTLLGFPRLTQDAAYLYNRLDFMLGTITESEFTEAFNAACRPELVHDFRRNKLRQAGVAVSSLLTAAFS